MLTSNPSALEVERATLTKTLAEADKLNAETAKILQETRWYPLVALGAMLVGFLGGLATIITIALKASGVLH